MSSLLAKESALRKAVSIVGVSTIVVSGSIVGSLVIDTRHASAAPLCSGVYSTASTSTDCQFADGVTHVTFDVFGAKGADGLPGAGGTGDGGVAGEGAHATYTAILQSNAEVIQVNVGQNGNDDAGGTHPRGDASGGDGGLNSGFASDTAGGGGSASDVRYGTFTLAESYVIAGGGGGGGGGAGSGGVGADGGGAFGTTAFGGDGGANGGGSLAESGGADGADGGDGGLRTGIGNHGGGGGGGSGASDTVGGSGGGGGQHSMSGSAGSGGTNGTNGTNASLTSATGGGFGGHGTTDGNGGDGSDSDVVGVGLGGGGGGGKFGGGAGGNGNMSSSQGTGGGGGAGSSYVDVSHDFAYGMAGESAAPKVVISAITSNAPSPTLTVGDSFAYTPTLVGYTGAGVDIPLAPTFSSTTLPAGLTLNTSTGAISGTVTTPGTTTVTLTATAVAALSNRVSKQEITFAVSAATTTTTATTSSTTTSTTTTTAPSTTTTTAVVQPSVGFGSSKSNSISTSPGSTVSVSGNGYQVGTTVTLTLHSTPVVLGTAVVNSSGVFSKSIKIPSDATLGAHTLVIAGTNSSGSATSATLNVKLSALASTGSSSLKVLLPLGVLLVGAGSTLVYLTRRLRQS